MYFQETQSKPKGHAWAKPLFRAAFTRAHSKRYRQSRAETHRERQTETEGGRPVRTTNALSFSFCLRRQTHWERDRNQWASFKSAVAWMDCRQRTNAGVERTHWRSMEPKQQRTRYDAWKNQKRLRKGREWTMDGVTKAWPWSALSFPRTAKITTCKNAEHGFNSMLLKAGLLRKPRARDFKKF